ncbi:MAG: hypothetical protein KDC48_03535 [Planctomycetes bacterium]|nr:hypothetical protein [Planctomycetota bacterium]
MTSLRPLRALSILLCAAFCVAQDPVLDDAPRTSTESTSPQRICDLAAQIQDPAVEAAPLFTELARHAGFAIWTEERAVVAAPLGPPLRLAITDSEVREFCELFRNGDTVQLADLTAGLDVFWQKCGVPIPCGPLVDEWRLQAFTGGAPGTHGLFVALQALGNLHPEGPDPIDKSGDLTLDPLQALMLVRVIGEDLMLPLRQAMETAVANRERPRGPNLGDDAFAVIDWPGWAEDGYAGTVTTLVGKAIENLDKFSGKAAEWVEEVLKNAPGTDKTGLEKLSRGFSIANAIAAVAKCIATYTFLRGEIRVEEPGQPLIRTRGGPAESQAGERRTLVAKFWIDGSKATDWMKENRPIVALAGIDIDMPKSGALKGIETEWDIKEDRHSSKYHLIRLADAVDISKIKTDDQGEARLAVLGRPQLRDLRKEQVLPVEKQVPIVVTPQVKSTEMQQDLVDSVFGALGILSVAEGNVEGLLTPVIECLYRMKWTGGRRFVLQVRDWIPAEVVGEVEIDIAASGSVFETNWSLQESIRRKLKFRDVKMAGGEVEVPTLDPMISKFLNETQRAQLEAGMEQARKMARQPRFQMQGQGVAELHVHDRRTLRGVFGECDPQPGHRIVTVDGDQVSDLAEPTGDLRMMMIDTDLDAKTARLTVYSTMLAKVHENKQIGKQRTERSYEEEWGIFTNLELSGQKGNVIEFELKETVNPVTGGIDYYGVKSVPFRFCDKRCTGNAMVTFSLHRRPKPQNK